MLESNIKQFYPPRSEDSAVNAYDKSRRFLWISCCWFCIYFKRLLLTSSDDCFCNVKKIFLTTIMYMTTRDAFTAAKNPHRIGRKRYLMNRSSHVLLIFCNFFILICQNCPDQGVNSCSFKEKGSWLLPKFI